MSPHELLSKRRKGVSLTLLGASVCAAMALIAAPITASIADVREIIEADRERLETLLAKREDLGQLENALKAAHARDIDRPLVLEASSAAVAAEKIEAMIRSLASSHSATVNSFRMLRSADISGLRAMRCEIDIVVSRDQIIPMIATVEKNAPLVFFEELRIDSEIQGSSENDMRLKAGLKIFTAITAMSAKK